MTGYNRLEYKFASLARCVRVSQLAGDGFIERYYPNRVKRQFGLAQDLPDYNKSLEGFKLYMPSRLARGYVTVRYRDWWVKSVSELMRCEEMRKETTETLNGRNRLNDDDVDASPKVLPLSQVVQNLEEGFVSESRISTTVKPRNI